MNGWVAILLVAATALAVNLPLGRLRCRYPKLSIGWFVAIHASIPVIVVMRVLLDVSWGWAPLFVAAAVGGQILGSAPSTSEA
jgi:hypothetical protein